MGNDVRSQGDVQLHTEPSVREEEWDRMVGSFCGSFLHSFAWSRYIGRVHGGAVSYFTIRRSGRPVAAGWYTISGKEGRWRGLSRRLQLETLPGFDPEALTPDAVFRVVLDLALEEKCISLSFGNSAPHYLDNAPISERNEKIGFQLDLGLPLERIYAGLHERHRTSVKKASAGGVEVRALTLEQCRELAGAISDMFSCSLTRHRTAGKDRPQGEVCSVTHIIEDLVRTNAATLFAAFVGNTPVSCSVVGAFDGQARLLYAASSEQGYRMNASFLLLWRIIEHYHQLGTRVFDLGEVPQRSENSGDQDHGLYKYKLRFGAEKRLLCSGTTVTRPGMHALVELARNCRDAVRRGRKGE